MEEALAIADEGLYNTIVSCQADGEKHLINADWTRGWEIDYSEVYITWNYAQRHHLGDLIGWFLPPES